MTGMRRIGFSRVAIRQVPAFVFSGPEVRTRIGRFTDLVIACALLLSILPLMAIVAIAIKCESPGPVLGYEERLGVGGGRFALLEFRTTRNAGNSSDPSGGLAVTWTGKFIRYTRIAEIPQIINVLRGDMTFLRVGPGRPRFLD